MVDATRAGSRLAADTAESCGEQLLRTLDRFSSKSQNSN